MRRSRVIVLSVFPPMASTASTFMPAMAVATSASMKAILPDAKDVTPLVPAQPVETAVPVESYIAKSKPALTKIVMVFNPARFEAVKDANLISLFLQALFQNGAFGFFGQQIRKR